MSANLAVNRTTAPSASLLGQLPVTLAEADLWVRGLTIAGGGWRMPKVADLKGLYQKGKGLRNITALIKTTGWYVWSGEKSGNTVAWVFAFNPGFPIDHYVGSSRDARVFAVRSRR